MSTATITFYKATKINPSRNMKIDSLESYLLPCKVFEKTKVQYQRTNPLEFNVKMDLSQIYTDFSPSYDIDYAKVQNTNSSRVLYYFITKRSWKSESTVEFHFVLDTINSFSISGTIGDTADYIISKRSNVLREHKDRFEAAPSSEKINKQLSSPTWTTYVGYHAADFEQPNSEDPYEIGNLADVNNIEILLVSALDGNNHLITPIPSNWEVSCSFVDINGNPIIDNNNTYGWLRVRVNNVSDAQYLTGINRIVIRVTINFLNKRIIDFQSEGLSPVLYKSEIGDLREECDLTWNLFYKTAKELSTEENNPVDCYLIPNDTFFETEEPSATATISATDLTAGKIYLFSYRPRNVYVPTSMGSTSEPPIELVTDDSISLIPNWTKWEGSYSQVVIAIMKNGANIDWYKLEFAIRESDTAPLGYVKTLANIFNIPRGSCATISVSGGIDRLYCYEDDYVDFYTLSNLSYDAPNFYFSLGNTGSSIDLASLEKYDRTDSKLIKIIEVPYCPADYVWDSANSTITILGMWGISSLDGNKTYKLGNFNTPMRRLVTTTLDNPFYAIAYVSLTLGKTLRNDIYESKLFHSDFYQIKFVYDSFSYVFQMEKMDFNRSNIRGKFQFTFVMTTTINSRFLFMFSDYVINNASEDYELICSVQRNNEKTIYNSTYLTYIRNGYNYDIKARDRTITASSVGLVTSIVGGIVGVALGIASENPAIIVSSVVGATSGVVASSVNTANTIANAEQSLEQKMQQLRNQATSVSGSDDIDLLNAYSNNRAKLVEYHVSDRMKKALADLFYYTGYVCNEQKVPSFTSRTYFNFIQMEIDIIEDNAGLSDEIANDLAMRWKNGVTIYHKVNNEWDIEQKYENWEVSLNG